jgi:hypothetical protein
MRTEILRHASMISPKSPRISRGVSTSLLSLGGLSVELETLDDLQRYFFGFAIADIHVSIS